ncbi:DNA mismatch repair protein Msh6 [Lamellibrachia satsuma]|nr:DNA mismatch repair protein Msh6 [Lamellibrachia satsuma]
MSKGNTLFAYFSKKPTLKSPEQNGITPKKNLPRKNCNKNEIVSAKAKSEKPSSFNEGDVVWAKLEGYPWWPSLVYPHKKGLTRKRGSQTEVHVQFFDQPVSRGWVKEK